MPSLLTREESYGFPAAGPSTLHSDSGSGGFQAGSADSLGRVRPSVYSGAPEPVEDEDDLFDSESDDPDPDRFVNFSLLSHLAVRLRDKVPRGTHVKSSIPYPRAFTGKDIVVSPLLCVRARCNAAPHLFLVYHPESNPARTADQPWCLHHRSSCCPPGRAESSAAVVFL